MKNLISYARVVLMSYFSSSRRMKGKLISIVLISLLSIGFTTPASAALLRVADFADDFASPTPAPGWQYLWNSGGAVGNPTNYSSLFFCAVCPNSEYTTDGNLFPAASPGQFTLISPGGAHPGPGLGTPNTGDPLGFARYAIAAFTVSADGVYSLVDTLANRLDLRSNGFEILVHVNGDAPVFNSVFADNGEFNLSLGQLLAGDTIYVALGANGSDLFDSVELDFTIALTVDSVPLVSEVILFGTSTGFGSGGGGGGSGGPGSGTGGGNVSQFHRVDITTGVATEISMDIGFGGDVGGLAANSNNVLFAGTGGRGPNNDGRSESPTLLFTIDPVTGLGSPAIGPLGIEFGPPDSAGQGPGAGDFDQFGSQRQNISGWSFDPISGDLYGMAARGSQLFTADTNTGLATRIGTPCDSPIIGVPGGPCRRGNAIAFDDVGVNNPLGTLFWANDVEIAELNPATGLIIGIPAGLDFSAFGPPANPDTGFRVVAMDYHPLTGNLYAAVQQGQADTSPPAKSTLAILDSSAGTFTIIGMIDNTGVKLDGIAFTRPETTHVDIDIKPDSDPNHVSPGSKGVIPVVILTTDTFDATTVDPSTLQFGNAGAGIAHKSAHFEDIEDDGDLDLMLHFRTQETGIECGDADVYGTSTGFGSGGGGGGSGGPGSGTGGGNVSQFHRVDITTGVATEISMDIGFGGDVGGLAANSNNVLFAGTGGRGPNNDGRSESPTLLFTIDPVTGLGSPAIGPLGIEFGPPDSAGQGPGAGDFDQFGSQRQNISGWSFDPISGDLYGMAARGSQLFTADTNTGLATRIGTPCDSPIIGVPGGPCRRGNAIAFDDVGVNNPLGTLFWANDVEIAELNPATGLIIGIPAGLDFSAFGPPANPDTGFRVVAMDYHPLTGNLYAAVQQGQADTSPPAKSTLAILDSSAGTFTIIGMIDNTGVKLDGIAFTSEVTLSLSGATLDGTPISGFDSIVAVGCKK